MDEIITCFVLSVELILFLQKIIKTSFMKKVIKLSTKLFFAVAFLCCIHSYAQQTAATQSTKTPAVTGGDISKYETISDDPLKARIYTLANGLKVYMTVYKNAPRIQTYIATRAGSKNDPADATGLAHYLEHMLFKGTDVYGSKDFVKESAELAKIEALYEIYRKTTDETKRKIVYHKIDSVSGYASKFAIANEYDKMMSSIGATGTNAYTWLEQTVYVNDIPSNQLDKWTTIESERFRNPVMRLFHTELEAVYEEKNRGLDNDGEKAWEALFAGLFPKNTYGSQTTIGTIEHLKNPSLKKIKEYYNTWYVPNNMAICLSGDFDMDETIKMIDKKFGSWKSKPIPTYVPYAEPPITEPVIKKVIGPDAENISIGYRFAGAGSKDADMIRIINRILYNGKAGLIDLNLNQKQKLINGNAMDMAFKDYSAHVLSATPKEGQSLDDVKALLLEQIEKVKKGDFPDWLLSAVITDMKYEQTKTYENNGARADAFVNAFISGQEWKNCVYSIQRLSQITKQQVMEFATKNYGNNYVVVYKVTGEDKSVQKVEKPAITPVEVNRNDQSAFVQKIISTPSQDIQPVFIDFEKDIQTLKLKSGIPVYYNQNKENKTFDMYYVLNMGTNNDKKLSVAIEYLKYLGTKTMKAEEVQQKFYRLGCSFDVYAGEDQIWVSLRGLTENFKEAALLFEDLLANAQPDETALKNLVEDILKKRTDAKLSKEEILYSAMFAYGKYGKQNPYTNVLSTDELRKLNPADLIGLVNKITSFDHHILYYGSATTDEFLNQLNAIHKTPEKLAPLPPLVEFKTPDANNNVYVANYDMKQAEIIFIAKDDMFDRKNKPVIRLFNEYFGGGMSSVVFQDMRESKALAYSVYSSYQSANSLTRNNFVFSYIGTQADKLPEAMAGMMNLINKMPESENNFKACKDQIIQSIRSERITKAGILFYYESAKKLGLTSDIRKEVFEKVPLMTLKDIRDFEENHVKNRQYTTLVVGKKEALDTKILEKYGKVTYLSLEEIFGY